MLTQSYGARERKAIDMLCEQFKKNNHINPYLYKKFNSLYILRMTAKQVINTHQ